MLSQIVDLVGLFSLLSNLTKRLNNVMGWNVILQTQAIGTKCSSMWHSKLMYRRSLVLCPPASCFSLANIALPVFTCF